MNWDRAEITRCVYLEDRGDQAYIVGVKSHTLLAVALLLLALTQQSPAVSEFRSNAESAEGSSSYFDLGQRLTQEFDGTYEFKHKRLEFVRNGAAYAVRSSGDSSPRRDTIILRDGFVYWVLGHSGERWIAFKTTLRRGDNWRHRLRGWNQQYRVLKTGETVSVPAGVFHGCAVVEVSWTAKEPDMKGPQKIVYYLAPRVGIIKREVWSGSEMSHEEVLTRYETE